MCIKLIIFLILLEFANVLEQLETQFYTEALSKFQVSDFTAAGFSDANVPIQQFQFVHVFSVDEQLMLNQPKK